MDGGDLGHLRQQDRDPVSAADAIGVKRVGQPIGGLLEPAEANRPQAAVGGHIENREPTRIEARPTIADINPNVVARRNLPTELTTQFVVVADSRKHERRSRATQAYSPFPSMAI